MNEILSDDEPIAFGALDEAVLEYVTHLVGHDAIEEGLNFRHIALHSAEFAVSKDGAKMFGLLELDQSEAGLRFALGVRNSHDKSMRLALTIGYRVFICSNMSFYGDFTPVLAKHSKHFRLLDAISIGLDSMQRNFEPMLNGVRNWQETQIGDSAAKLTIYRAFVEGDLDVPRHLAREVHSQYFNPQYPEFEPRTIWSLSNAFTSAFKTLEPIPQFRATAALAAFLA